MTLDGKIAAYTGHSKWITGSEARREVHYLRDEVDGILVGVGTVLADNPKLTTRLDGKGKNPVRIIMDSRLRTPLDAYVADCREAATIIVTTMDAREEKAKQLAKKGVKILTIPSENGKIDSKLALKMLYKEGITDILLEGGSEINANFMRNNLIQKYLVYVAPKILGGKTSYTPFRGEDVETVDEAVPLQFTEVQKVGEDLKITAYPLQQ